MVRGPVLGGTIDGLIDYSRDEVHLRGTLVPLYGANNLLGQIPVVGLFLGGEKEGLLGVTYEVVGKPASPILHVNPLSALAPGLLRKVFEFPSTQPYTPTPPPAMPKTPRRAPSTAAMAAAPTTIITTIVADPGVRSNSPCHCEEPAGRADAGGLVPNS